MLATALAVELTEDNKKSQKEFIKQLDENVVALTAEVLELKKQLTKLKDKKKGEEK